LLSAAAGISVFEEFMGRGLDTQPLLRRRGIA
jgi:hypothetical protein